MSDQFGNILFSNAHRLWVDPEIERRRAGGRLPDKFRLQLAQVILDLRLPQEVRLNEEVKANILGVREGRPMVSTIASIDEFDKIEKVTLTDADPNAAHLTMFFYRSRWIVAFDFRYNSQTITHTLRAANEFIAASNAALEQNHHIAFHENLFSATELAAKALMLSFPDRDLLQSKKHGTIQAKMHMRAKHKIVGGAYAKLLQRLQDRRRAARYSTETDFNLDEKEARQLQEEARELLALAEHQAPSRK